MIKIRIGWGQTGNQNLPPYMNQEYFDPLSHSRYAFGSSQTVYRGYQIYSSTGNPNLTWEKQTMTNLGADFSLLRNKLEFSMDYYIKDQNKMLVQQVLPYFVGRDSAASPWVNTGQVRNKGFEFSMNYRNSLWDLSNSSFEYSFGANITTINNKVVSLPAGNIYLWLN